MYFLLYRAIVFIFFLSSCGQLTNDYVSIGRIYVGRRRTYSKTTIIPLRRNPDLTRL